MGGQVTVFTLK